MFHYELFTKTYGYFFDLEMIEKKKTSFQEMVIATTPVFGKILILDNVIQIAEIGERSYHEPMVHYPLLMHPSPKRVLILGGGDGCIAREVLKHKTVKEVVMVDIDGEVVEASKKHFLEINKNPYADKRLMVVIDDAIKYIRENTEKFDIIFMDLVDPVGPGKFLYQKDTIDSYKQLLNPNGIIISHAQSISPPHYAAEKFYVKLNAQFAHIHLYTSYIQPFGDLWGFVAVSDGLDFQDQKLVRKAKRKLKKIQDKDLQVVNSEFFDAAYHLPNWVKKKITEFSADPDTIDFVPTVIDSGYADKII